MLRTYQNHEIIKMTSTLHKSVFKNALASQWASRYPAIRKTDSLGYDYEYPEGGKPYFTAWKDKLPKSAIEEALAIQWATYEAISGPLHPFNKQKRGKARELLTSRGYSID